MALHGPHDVEITGEAPLDERSRCRVDYAALVDGDDRLLCEATAPSVMKKLGELLPARGFEFGWTASSSLVRKILGKVSTLRIFLKLQCWF